MNAFEKAVAFAESIKDLPFAEQKKAIYEAFDKKEIDPDELAIATGLEESPCYIPGLFDWHPTILVMYHVEKENEERAAQGLPPVYAR